MKLMWAVKWRSDNRLDGKREYIMWDAGFPLLFETRRAARAYVGREHGYLRDRPDLRGEPHGWKMPLPVRVRVSITEGKD